MSDRQSIGTTGRSLVDCSVHVLSGENGHCVILRRMIVPARRTSDWGNDARLPPHGNTPTSPRW